MFTNRIFYATKAHIIIIATVSEKLPALCIFVAGLPSPNSNVRLHWSKLGPRWRQKETSYGRPTAALGKALLKCGFTSFSTILMVWGEKVASETGDQFKV